MLHIVGITIVFCLFFTPRTDHDLDYRFSPHDLNPFRRGTFLICMIQLMLTRGRRTISVICVGQVCWVGSSVSNRYRTNLSQPTAGEELDDSLLYIMICLVSIFGVVPTVGHGFVYQVSAHNSFSKESKVRVGIRHKSNLSSHWLSSSYPHDG